MDTLKAKMIEALAKTYGRVTDAARMVKIHRTTHYLWMDDDPEYKNAVDEMSDIALDFVESKLFELIDGAQREVMTESGPLMVKETPNPTACIFYLKTKGKKRGYIERNEITGADGKDAVNIIISKDL
jgi:hypothetical protein